MHISNPHMSNNFNAVEYPESSITVIILLVATMIMITMLLGLSLLQCIKCVACPCSCLKICCCLRMDRRSRRPSEADLELSEPRNDPRMVYYVNHHGGDSRFPGFQYGYQQPPPGPLMQVSYTAKDDSLPLKMIPFGNEDYRRSTMDSVCKRSVRSTRSRRASLKRNSGRRRRMAAACRQHRSRWSALKIFNQIQQSRSSNNPVLIYVLLFFIMISINSFINHSIIYSVIILQSDDH